MDKERNGSGSTVTVAVVGVIFLLAGYIFSPIPVFVLCGQTGLADSEWAQTTVETAYAPIIWAADNSPAVKNFYESQATFCEKIGVTY